MHDANGQCGVELRAPTDRGLAVLALRPLSAALGGHHESAWADHPAVGMDHADQVIEK